VNLGHVYRKLRQYTDAIFCYEKALGLRPGMPGTFAALGYTYHLQVRPGLLPPRGGLNRTGSDIVRKSATFHYRSAFETRVCQNFLKSAIKRRGALE
jgi:hypothetical protein